MKKIAPIIILIIISVLLIFYRFGNIPRYLAFDEVEFAKLSLSLDNKPYIPYSQLATGHSTLYFYILLASLKIFGVSTSALRFPAAVFGILSVVMFFLIIKSVFQSAFAKASADKQYFLFLLTLIFLTSRWFLNFARFSFEATFLLFLELTSIYFLLRANARATIFLRLGIPRFLRGGFPLELKKLLPSIYVILSGLFSGLAFLSYTPGRIFFLLPMGFLLFRKQFNNLPAGRQGEIMKQLLLFLIPFVIVITPLTSYLLTNKDTRIDQQFFLRNHEMTVNEKVNGLWSNVSSTTLMLFTKGDMNGRHNYPGKPALNPILGILFIVGLVITMKSTFAKASMDKQWNTFFLLYFLLSIFPALMTYPWENPNMLRTYTVIPAIVYFIGKGLMSFPRRRESILIITALILLSSFYELRTYFKYQSTVFNQSFEIKLPLEKAIKVKILL